MGIGKHIRNPRRDFGALIASNLFLAKRKVREMKKKKRFG